MTRVVLVTSPGPHYLRGTALLGFRKAVKDSNIQVWVVQFDPRHGTKPTLASLARQKYDLVLVGEVQSPLDVDAVVAVAKSFPQVKFVLVDPPFLEPWPKNVQGPIWRVEEPAYLAGYLAGLEERRRPGRDVIGSVGGFKIPTVDACIAGFQAGARKASPGSGRSAATRTTSAGRRRGSRSPKGQHSSSTSLGYAAWARSGL